MRLQVHVYPASSAQQAQATCSFLEVTPAHLTLEDLSLSICKRYRRLYPHRAELQIDKLQDSECNDLDLSYKVLDVFLDKSANKFDSVVRVIQASNLRESSIPPESALRPNLWKAHRAYRGSHLDEEEILNEHGPQEQRSSKRQKLQEMEIVEDSLDETGLPVNGAGGEHWLGDDERDGDYRREDSVLEDTFQRMHSPELGGGVNGCASARFSQPIPADDKIEIVGVSQASTASVRLPNGNVFLADAEINDETQSSPMLRRPPDPTVGSQSLPPLLQTEAPSPFQAAENRPRYRPSPVPAPSGRHKNSASVTRSVAKRKGRKDLEKAKVKQAKNEATPKATKPGATTVGLEAMTTKKRARKDNEPTGSDNASPDAKASSKKVRMHSPVTVRQSQPSSTPSAERDMGPPPVPNFAMKRSNLKRDPPSQEPQSANKKRSSVSFAEGTPSSQGFPGSSAPSMISTPTLTARLPKRTPIVCPLPSTDPLPPTNPPRVVTPILPPGFARPAEEKKVVAAQNPPSRKPESSSGSESESGSGSDSESKVEAVSKPVSTKATAPVKPKATGKQLADTKASSPKASAPRAGSVPVQTNNDDSDVEDAPPPSTTPVSSKATPPKKSPPAAKVLPPAPAAKNVPHVVLSDSESEGDDLKPPASAQIQPKPLQSSQVSKSSAPKKPESTTESDASKMGSDTGSESEDESDDEPNSTNKAASALNSLLGKAKFAAQSLVKPKAGSLATTNKLSSLGDLESRVKFDVREIHASQQASQQASQSIPSSQPTVNNVKPMAERVVDSESESGSDTDSDLGSDSDSDSDSDDGSKSKGAIPDHKKAGSNKKKPAGAMGFGRIFSGV